MKMKILLLGLIMIFFCSACDKREVVLREVETESEQVESSTQESVYQIFPPDDWQGTVINWLIPQVAARPLTLDIDALNQYLEDEGADYRVQVHVLTVGEDTINVGEDYNEKAIDYMQKTSIDLLHFGFFHMEKEFEREIIHTLIEQNQLLELQEVGLPWAEFIEVNNVIYGTGDPRLNVVGLFVPEGVEISIDIDQPINWLAQQDSVVLEEVSAIELFFGQKIYEDLFIYEQNEWKYWWQTDYYHQLSQINWEQSPNENSVYLVNLERLDDWSKDSATYQEMTGTFIELGMNQNARSAQLFGELELGVLATSEHPDEVIDLLQRLSSDAELVRILTHNQFTLFGDRIFYNQWLLYDETLPERLISSLASEVIDFQWDVANQSIYEINQVKSTQQVYQELLNLQTISENDLKAFEEVLNEKGLEDLLDDIQTQYVEFENKVD